MTNATKLREQLQPLLRMKNRDYAHVVRHVIAQPPQLPGAPSHQGCGWKPHRRRRAWEWGARLGANTIIDRQDWEIDISLMNPIS